MNNQDERQRLNPNSGFSAMIADPEKMGHFAPGTVYTNIWGKEKSASLPLNAEPILAFQLREAGFGFDIILFIVVTNTRDELWVINTGEDGLYDLYGPLSRGEKGLNAFRTDAFDSPYCSLAIAHQDSEYFSAYYLLKHFCRAIIPYQALGCFIAPGLLTDDVFKVVTTSINDLIKLNRKKARENDSEIIQTAKRLKLHLTPPFLSQGIWTAVCPGTNHHLHLSSTTDTFGCGYCCEKGGPLELEIFIRERRKDEPEKWQID